MQFLLKNSSLKLLLKYLYCLGQAVPPGLHVRLNMKTGKKEAKLLEGEERKFPLQTQGMHFFTNNSFTVATDIVVWI